MKHLLLLLFVSAPALAQKDAEKPKAPYKIIIFADAGARSRATQFKHYLKLKAPYNKMKDEDLEIKVMETPKDTMGCSNSNPDSPRIVTCNTRDLNKIKASEEAHLAMAFTSEGTGGSGGDMPTASPDYPIQTMLHETLHTYGMADEYCYKGGEIKTYCNPPTKKPNSAHFDDTPPYASDSTARSMHAKDVPWMSAIPVDRHITQGSSLGSEPPAKIKKGEQVIGLYRGGTCDEKVDSHGKKTQSWRPYPLSIMGGYDDDTVYPLYEDVIVKNIESKLGRKLALKSESEAKKDAAAQVDCEVDLMKNHQSIENLDEIRRKLKEKEKLEKMKK